MLFDLPSLVEKKDSEKPQFTALTSKAELHFLKSNKEMASCIGELTQGKIVLYITENQWSMPDLLRYCAMQLGQCKLYFTTWAMSEEAIREMVSLKKQGVLTHLYALLEYKIRQNKDESFQLLQHNADHIGLTKIHAKLTILVNDAQQTGIIINSSANMNENKRIESGAIICDYDNAQVFANFIYQKIISTEQQWTSPNSTQLP